jgi:hypothetical protein
MEQLIFLLIIFLLPGILRSLAKQAQKQARPPGGPAAPGPLAPRPRPRAAAEAEPGVGERPESRPSPLEEVLPGYDEVMADLEAESSSESQPARPLRPGEPLHRGQPLRRGELRRGQPLRRSQTLHHEPLRPGPAPWRQQDEEAASLEVAPPVATAWDAGRREALHETVSPSARPVQPSTTTMMPMAAPSTHPVEMSILASRAAVPRARRLPRDSRRGTSPGGLYEPPPGPRGWRRALVLSEVLGPPRALRAWHSATEPEG